jgi:hypothetical protein
MYTYIKNDKLIVIIGSNVKENSDRKMFYKLHVMHKITVHQTESSKIVAL